MLERFSFILRIGGKDAMMIDLIFDYCVWLLVISADMLGTTYKAINVWIFVIIWPLITLGLIGLVIWQGRKIKKLLQ